MSERRRKRTRKTSSEDVRSLQARKGEPGVQAETKSMPQPEGEAVAETDTTNTKITGGNMGESFMDRIREHKATIIQVVVVIAIAVLVSAVMIMQLAATKTDIAAEATRVDEGFDAVTTHINTLGTRLNDRMDDVEVTAQTVGDAIESIQTWKDATDPRITALEGHDSPPEGYLTGNFSGNYTLHAICDTAGNYTANVNLVYLTPVAVGNTTQEDALQTFYGSINWAGVVPNYVCTTTYSGNTTTWGISTVWWNIGIFTMAANNETLVNITPAGLNSTYNPSFAYVEVWPVLK